MSDPETRFTIEWIDYQREPQQEPNPAFPDGIDIDTTRGQRQRCSVVLPYPAKRCGLYVVKCRLCGMTVGATTAGRADDPRRLTFPCKTVRA